MGVVAVGTCDATGGVDRFAVDVVIAVGVGIRLLEDCGAAGRADGTVVVIDDAAGIGGGQRVVAGGGTTTRGVAADVVIGVGTGVQLVIGIGAAGARAMAHS